MKPVIDMEKEYGLVFDGGGARGAYQAGAWKALAEAGLKINAVAGTSVGALNGALVCMGDVELAESIWKEISFSKVMDVDDAWMEILFQKGQPFKEVVNAGLRVIREGGVDITPLRNLIRSVVEEDRIRNCGKEFCLQTFCLSDMEELDLSLSEIPEGLLCDFLLASAYLIGFKNEPLHGSRYVDGGAVNNVPVNALLKRGYKDIIEVRIYGPGRIPKVHFPEDGTFYRVAPRVRLGSILEFSAKRSAQNLKIGYYDAKRMLYGLEGHIYYLEQCWDDEFYREVMSGFRDIEKAEILLELKLPPRSTDKELFLGMLEAAAKLLRVQKYHVYTVKELLEKVEQKRSKEDRRLPRFMEYLERAGQIIKTREGL
ncbi:patatin-like phospholipase family protein [Suipraeoptans intestinalis]|uniref:patatin-like phospholipase family protein n=1 Tax=Suipraeoptans intestinalis TaxID=2606628 RepID=UPI002ED2444D